jgi:hypothetical protein
MRFRAGESTRLAWYIVEGLEGVIRQIGSTAISLFLFPVTNVQRFQLKRLGRLAALGLNETSCGG